MLLKFLFALQKYENKVKRPISSPFFCVKMMFQWHVVPILWPSERKKFHGYSVQGGNYPYFNLTFNPELLFQSRVRLNRSGAAVERESYVCVMQTTLRPSCKDDIKSRYNDTKPLS